MLSARGVERSYAGKRVLMIDRLDVEPGAATALVGPNGAGKSTLLRILGFVERPDAGTLVLDQSPVVSETARRNARRLVTLVEQRPLLFPGTVRDNLRYALRLHGADHRRSAQRIDAALERMGAGALAERLARELSDGETQRVAVARALCLEPKILLLDEPLSAADRAAQRDLHRALDAARASDVAIVIASHQLEEAFRWSDRLLSLAGGSLSRVTPENLFRAVLTEGPPERTVRIGPLDLALVTDRVGPVTIVIPPDDIVVSREPLSSSARNLFRGRIKRISDDGRGTVTLTVDAGLDLSVRITHRSMEQLGLAVGAEVMLTVKSMAVRVY